MIPLVRFSHVSKTFNEGAIPAAVDLSLEVPPGARIALIGRSGSGKTTVLNLMAGLDQPSAGEVSWPGLTLPLRPAQVGIAFQGPSLIPWLNIEENIALPLQVAEQEPEPDQVAGMLDWLAVADVRNKLPGEVSTGQAQRVALARAMICRPRLLLADEPTGQLDRQTASHEVDALLTWAAQASAAIVIATHDREVAARLETVWSLDHGRLVEIPK